MSYCRMGKESDVYAWEEENEVYGIWFEGKSIRISGLENFKEKMLEIKSRGNKIPDYAFDLIEEELREKRTKNT